MTRVAGDMMGCGDVVALFITLHPISHSHNLAGDLMAQHQRCLVDAIPFHHIAAADAAGMHLYQQLAGADLGRGHLLQPHIIVVVVHCYAHCAFSGNSIVAGGFHWAGVGGAHR